MFLQVTVFTELLFFAKLFSYLVFWTRARMQISKTNSEGNRNKKIYARTLYAQIANILMVPKKSPNQTSQYMIIIFHQINP